jgi:hypothetical protein
VPPTTLSVPDLNLALFPGVIQSHPQHRLLYCRPCATVVLPRTLPEHLRRFHRGFAASQRRLLVQHCETLDLITAVEDLQLQLDKSPPLPFLPVHKGYSCSQCRYLTCSRKRVRIYANKIHKLCLQACTNSYKLVQLMEPRLQKRPNLLACL